VDIEPEDAVIIEPLDGFLSPEGSATLHFKRSSNSASMGRINCKVCLIIELRIGRILKYYGLPHAFKPFS